MEITKTAFQQKYSARANIYKGQGQALVVNSDKYNNIKKGIFSNSIETNMAERY